MDPGASFRGSRSLRQAITWARVIRRSSIGRPNAGEGHEFFQVVPVRPPGVRVVDVREPLGFGRHIGELGEFCAGERPPGQRRALGVSCFEVAIGALSYLDKIYYQDRSSRGVGALLTGPKAHLLICQDLANGDFRSVTRLNPALSFAQQLIARSPATALELRDEGFRCHQGDFGPAGRQMQFLPRGGYLSLDGIDALQIDSVGSGERCGRLPSQDSALGDFQSLGLKPAFALQELERRRIQLHRSSL